MPVSNQTPYKSSVASGGSTYPFPFKVLSEADLVVALDGTVKTLNTDYAVTISADPAEGGSVVFQPGRIPAAGSCTVAIRRVTPLNRTTDYQEAGGFRQGVVDTDFDRLVMMMQEQNEQYLQEGAARELADASLSNAIAAVGMGMPSNSFDDFSLSPKFANVITKGAWVDVRAFANVANPNGDIAAAIAAIHADPALGPLQLWGDQYWVDETIPVSLLDLVVIGVAGDRHGATTSGFTRGTQIMYTGAGACFEIGQEVNPLWNPAVPHAWDAGDYDGFPGLRFSHLSIKHANPDTPLNNGRGSYKAGSYGIRDWRGGSVRLFDVQIENFEYNFWGIQSDINKFWDITSLYSKYGIYAGPRSDQFDIYGLYSFFCDTALVVDGSLVRLHAPQIVGCGSATDYPIVVKNGSRGLEIEGGLPWAEKLQGFTGEVPAFIQAGVVNGYGNNSNPVPLVSIKSPFIGTKAQGDPAGYTKYYVEIGSAFVLLDSPQGVYSNNLSKLVSFKNNADGTAYDNGKSAARVRTYGAYDWAAKLYDNNGTGTPGITCNTKLYDSEQISSTNARVYLNRLPDGTNRDFYLSSEYERALFFTFHSSGDNNQRIKFYNRLWIGGVSKTYDPTGSWDQGDWLTYNNAAAGDPIGKRCTVSGTVGVYAEGLTATADGTNVIVLSGVSAVLVPGMWIVVNGVKRRIISKAGASYTLDAIVAAGAGMAITFAAPAFVEIGGQSLAQADSVAGDVGGLKADFNALLAKLRAAGLLAT